MRNRKNLFKTSQNFIPDTIIDIDDYTPEPKTSKYVYYTPIASNIQSTSSVHFPIKPLLNQEISPIKNPEIKKKTDEINFKNNTDNVNKDNVNKDNVNKDNINKDNVIKDNVIKDNVIKDNVNKDNVNKDNVIKDNTYNINFKDTNDLKDIKNNIKIQNFEKKYDEENITMKQEKKNTDFEPKLIINNDIPFDQNSIPPLPSLTSFLSNMSLNESNKLNETNIKDVQDIKEDTIENTENIEKQINNDFNTYSEEDLLFNLNIIAELKNYDKLSCYDKLFRIDDHYYSQGLMRWWYGDDRCKTLSKLNNVVDETFKYIDNTYLNELLSDNKITNEKNILYENNSEKLQKFYLALNNTIKGLDKLKSTYNIDTSMTTGLDLLMEKIRTRKEKINEILKIKNNSFNY